MTSLDGNGWVLVKGGEGVPLEVGVDKGESVGLLGPGKEAKERGG